MDSPEIKCLGSKKSSKSMAENIPMNTDDSGYMTVTPSSVDLTALSGGNSRRPLSRIFNISSDVRCNNMGALSLSTPRGKRCYRYTGEIQSRPKQLQEYFVKKTPTLCSHVNDTTQLFNNVVSNALCISADKKAENNIISNAHNKTKDFSNMQSAMCLMEWSDGKQTESTKFISDSGTDKCISNVLPTLVVSNLKGCQPTSVFEFKGDTSSYQSVASCSLISKENSRSGETFKSSFSRGEISPVTETFSYSNTPHKNNYKDKFRNNFPLTPVKNEYLPSPILKCDYLVHKSAKKMNCDSQKIGTPEKNSILYSNLKPVNFPRKIKSPEKLRSSTVSSTKCRKKLFSKTGNSCRIDYSGQKFIDFLKMLGEQQNHVPAVKSILSYLSCKDLMKVCCVSKIWNKVCCNDVRAALRKRAYARQIEMQKENINAHLQMSPNKKSKLEMDTIPSSAKGHKMLAEIDNNNRNRMTLKPPIQRSPPVSPGKRKFKTHMNVVMKHPDSSIRQCLRCRRPATVESHWATCSGLDCGFRFCTRCSTEYSSSYVCCQKSIQSVSPSKDSHSKLYIGTKKSRRNLLRL